MWKSWQKVNVIQAQDTQTSLSGLQLVNSRSLCIQVPTLRCTHAHTHTHTHKSKRTGQIYLITHCILKLPFLVHLPYRFFNEEAEMSKKICRVSAAAKTLNRETLYLFITFIFPFTPSHSLFHQFPIISFCFLEEMLLKWKCISWKQCHSLSTLWLVSRVSPALR